MRSVSPWGALNLQFWATSLLLCPAQGPELFSNERVRGGSPWGAGTFAGGDGSRQPSELELDFAKYQARTAALPPQRRPAECQLTADSGLVADCLFGFHIPTLRTSFIPNNTMSAHNWFAGHVFHAQDAHRRALANQVAGTMVQGNTILL